MCGTFDPPHIGHLLLAQTAFNQLELDHVLFLPVGDPTHKTTKTAAEFRVAMTQLAISDNPNFILDTTDADRPDPHYTATLLPLLHRKFPTAKLWLLIGGDSLSTFPSWNNPQEILNFCRLAILSRPGWQPDIEYLASEIPGIEKQIDWLDGPSVNLSSSWLRQAVANQISTRYLLSSELANYVEENQLYG